MHHKVKGGRTTRKSVCMPTNKYCTNVRSDCMVTVGGRRPTPYKAARRHDAQLVGVVRRWTHGRCACKSFKILVSNFTNVPQHLSKNTLVACAGPTSEHHVPMHIPLSTKPPTEAIATVNNNELRLTKRRSACVQSHVPQSQKRAINDARDWHETVQIG